MAKTFYYLNKYPQALGEIKQVIADHPSNYKACYLQGLIYKNMGDFPLAVESFKEVIDYDPEFAKEQDLENLIEDIQVQLEIKLLQEDLKSDPDNTEAIRELGETYLTIEDYDRALEQLWRAYELNSQDSKIIFLLAETYACKEDYHNALELYRKVLAIEPDNYIAMSRIGEIYREEGDLFLAIETLEESIKINSESSIAYCSLGVAYYELGNIDKAIEYLNRAITIEPDFSWAFGCLGEIYFHLNDYVKARDYFNKALELDSESNFACASLGEVSRLEGDLDSALIYASKAIELEPEFVWAYGTRGAIYLETGQLEKARHDLEQAIGLDPEYTWAYYVLGLVLYRMGYIIEPVECMIEVLEEDVEELVYPVVSFLENLKGERVVNILIDNYDRTSPVTKYWIVYLLGRTGHIKAFPLLRKALEDEYIDIRWEAAQSMGSMGPKAYLPLIKALSDPEPVVRSSSVMILGRLGIHKSVRHIKKALKDEDFTVRFWAGLALKEMKDSE